MANIDETNMSTLIPLVVHDMGIILELFKNVGAFNTSIHNWPCRIVLLGPCDTEDHCTSIKLYIFPYSQEDRIEKMHHTNTDIIQQRQKISLIRVTVQKVYSRIHYYILCCIILQTTVFILLSSIHTALPYYMYLTATYTTYCKSSLIRHLPYFLKR